MRRKEKSELNARRMGKYVKSRMILTAERRKSSIEAILSECDVFRFERDKQQIKCGK